jgi:hypothetical protein
MFVTKSRFDKMKERAQFAEAEYIRVARKYNNLNDQWNALVARINSLGGDYFLLHAKIPADQTPQFTADDLQRLIQLCHPDRHDGKPLATQMTQKLLKVKEATAC